VGGVPHVPPHVRVAALRAGPQRRPGTALAGPPFGGVHARDLRALTRRRPGAPLEIGVTMGANTVRTSATPLDATTESPNEPEVIA
jgi:hypothetical protein